MPALEPFVILLGQLVAVAFASGLNLYGTVFVLGLTARLDWFGGLPPELGGLENAIVIALAGVLFLVEFVVDKIPQADSAWDAVHTLVRPAAAALLAFLALQGMGWGWSVAGALLAGGTALAAHGLKAGVRLLLNAQPWRARNLLLSLAEDVVAAGVAVAALLWPTAALLVLGILLGGLLVVGPRFWRASVLGLRGLNARLRGFFGKADWRGPEEMPASVRRLVRPPPLGGAQPRGVRAAALGLRGVGAYRNGWVVVEHDGRSFFYRSWRGGRRASLPVAEQVEIRPGVWADVLVARGGEADYTLFVLKDGPDAAVTAALLR